MMNDWLRKYTVTAAAASSQMMNVITTPKRPSFRLPASSCTEPGNRKFSRTSHQARVVIDCLDRRSG